MSVVSMTEKMDVVSEYQLYKEIQQENNESYAK